MYAFGVAFSILLVTNGCLTMSLSDNLKEAFLRRTVKFYCLVAMFVYPLCVFGRFSLFSYLQNDMQTLKQEDFVRGFKALFERDNTMEIVFFSFVCQCYFLCYCVIIFVICTCTQLANYLKS